MYDRSKLPTPAAVAGAYAARGYEVFPCNPATKAPLTPHGFKDATSDPDTLAAWWKRHPDALVAVPTGATSGVFVLDLDICDDPSAVAGVAWLQSVGLAHLLDGPGAITPSGGRHVYFRADGLAQGLTITAGKIAPKVDTRGKGGYIIAPGSVRPDGAYRSVYGGLMAGDFPKLPDIIRRALDGPPKAKPGASQGPDRRCNLSLDPDYASKWGASILWSELVAVATAPAGTRNDRLNRSAFAVAQASVAGKINPLHARAHLEAAALSAGLSIIETRATIASGWAKGLQSPRVPKGKHYDQC